MPAKTEFVGFRASEELTNRITAALDRLDRAEPLAEWSSSRSKFVRYLVQLGLEELEHRLDHEPSSRS